MTPEEQCNFTLELNCTQSTQFKAVGRKQKNFIEHYNLMKFYVTQFVG